MKAPEIFKVYKKITKIGEDYYEAEYDEYMKFDRNDPEYAKHENGVMLRERGTEDFTGERLRKSTKTFDVYFHSGQVMHGAYREGWKMTRNVGTIRTSLGACKIQVARMLYGGDVVRVS